MKLKPLIIKKEEAVQPTVRKLLTPDEYAFHLKNYCHLTDQETKIVLANVYKRIEKDLDK
jgi:hypothetical protein